MTLQPPPPPSATSIPAGRAGTIPFLKGDSTFHIIKHSDNSPGVDYSLRSLVRLWNEGYPVGSRTPAISPLQVRLNTIRLIDMFLAVRQGGALPSVLGTAPARLSDVGISIGSTTIKTRKQHIDDDWFGPPGTSWWRPAADGQQFEVKIAECIREFLQHSLGDRAIQRPNIVDALAAEETSQEGRPSLSPTADIELLAEAHESGVEDLYIEWWISDKDAPGALKDVECEPFGNKLVIRTPDIQ